jgi:hypothetical protein
LNLKDIKWAFPCRQTGHHFVSSLKMYWWVWKHRAQSRMKSVNKGISKPKNACVFNILKPVSLCPVSCIPPALHRCQMSYWKVIIFQISSDSMSANLLKHFTVFYAIIFL